ncbi:succinylglutamate desuccinylase [Pyramidobacter piscolens]|uniref:succinylglutamate desuccinylase n=1 Tax=Pyramidobacter piscolens TaxID=638849 RepID=UPI0028EE83DB|nr:succinylglutamate desuccinylase [Pyramidobacter piscolens]
MSENNSANKGRGNFLTGLILAAILGAGILTVGKEFRYQFNVEPIYKGPGVTSVKMLSDYNPFLKGTNGDSKVYVLDSGKPGGNFIIMGGTHPTEPGGLLAAILFVENAVVTEGKIMVVPHSNNSGFSTCEPGLGHVPYFHIATPSGKVRYFRYGNRGSNPVDQFPDPDMYLHYPSGQNLAADEIRNLDRAHPGNPHGLLTQQIAYAFNRMCWDEGADMIIDHHEAPPEKPLVNAICVHQKGIDLTSEMALMLEEQNIRMRVEISPIPLHGFSHRELGDYTPAIAFLSETPNPSQGSARGVTYEELIIDGKDEVYRHLLEDKLLKVDYKSEGVTLNERTGRNVATDLSLAEIYSDLGEDARNEYGGYPKDLGELKPDAALKIDDATAQRMLAKGPEGERKIVITNMPSYEDIMQNGIGRYLRDADATAEEIEAAKKAAE